MRRLSCGSRAGAILAAGPFFLGVILWSGTNMNIKLLPLPLDDAASVTRVQLFIGSGVQLLAASGGELSVITEGPGHADRVPAMQLGGGQAWDARRLDGGPLGGTFFTAVYVQAGSATSSIMSKTAKARSGTRLHEEAFAVYVQPHYVKGRITTLPVTAIHLKDGRAQAVLFSYDPQSGAPTMRPAGDPAPLMTDARLLADATGYWMFTLVPAESEAAPRETGTATRAPGLLHAVRLDAHLKPHGDAFPVFGDHPVYEFDIDAAPENQAAIFATTPAGAIYAQSALNDAPLPADAWKETRFARPLSSPSLLIHDGIPQLAAIEQPAEPEARILRGRVE